MCEKRVFITLATCFLFSRQMGMIDSILKLCGEVETVYGFCYFGDWQNASGGSEVTVTAKVRIGWVSFRE